MVDEMQGPGWHRVEYGTTVPETTELPSSAVPVTYRILHPEHRSFRLSKWGCEITLADGASLVYNRAFYTKMGATRFADTLWRALALTGR